MHFDFDNLKKRFNDVYYSLLSDKHRYLVLMGGASSGKSYGTAQKIITRILADGIQKKIKHKFLVLRKTQPAVRKSVYTLFDVLLHNWKLYDSGIVKQNKSDMSYTFNFDNFQSQILCGGLDDVEKLKSIEGVTSVWLEEATELNDRDFLQVDLRLRGETKSYKQIVLTFNPISKFNWAYKTFFEKEKANTKIVVTTYRDNRFTDAEYIKVLQSLKDEDETMWQIYSEAQWGTLRHIIYRYKTIPSFDNLTFDETVYGLDFGYNNPMALIEASYRENQVYNKELLYESHLKTPELIDKMKILIPENNRQKYIFCDPSRPDAIQELCDAGFNAMPGNNKVIEGLEYCRRKTAIVEAGSVNLIKELDNYKYKETKDGDIKEEPVKFRDHICDAKRYAEYTYYLMQKENEAKSGWGNMSFVSFRDD